MKNFYRHYFSKIHLLFIVAALLALVVQGCKKKGDEVTVDIIEEKLAGADSLSWQVPFSIISCGDPVVQKLTLYRDHRYTYSESAGCEQSGTWKAEYFANRSGQHVRIEFHHSDGNFTPIELKYSNSSGTFYYLDNEKGLVELIRLRELSWVPRSFPELETFNLRNREGMASAVYDGEVYFGLGDNFMDESPSFSDWYKFDGERIIQLASAPVQIYGAKAAVVGTQIYLTGGEEYDFGNTTITYVYDPLSNTWSYFEAEGEDYTQYRRDHVYLSLGGSVEVITMGSGGGYGLYYRTSTSTPSWEEYDPNVEPNAHVLVIPWQNGYLLSGGKYEETYSNNGFQYIQRSGNTISYSNISIPAIAGGNPFAHGAGVEYNGMALAFGLETYDDVLEYYTYKNEVHLLENNHWKVFPYTSGPIPAKGTVFWKVGSRIFGGLGVNGTELYELVIR